MSSLFDTDINHIVLGNDIIYKNLTRVYGDSFINNLDQYLMFVSEWISRNAIALGTKNIGKRISFYDTDESKIFEIFQVDKNYIKELVKRSNYIQKNWAISIRPLNILMYTLVFFYYDVREELKKINPNIEPYRIANVMLSARFFSSLIIRQFKYEPDDAIMAYTLENLSNKFIIKKMNSLYEMIQYLADTNIDSWIESDKANSRDDKDLDAYMRKLNTRISSNLVNISREFYENHKNDKRVLTESNTVEFEDGKTDIAITTNVSNELAMIQKKVIQNLYLDSQVNVKMLRVACKNTGVSYKSMYNVVFEIQKNQDDLMETIMNNILAYFIVSERKSSSQIHSYTFFECCIRAYRVSNSKDEYILEIKRCLNDLLTKYSELYAKSNRLNTKSDLRSTMYIYLVFLITKLA